MLSPPVFVDDAPVAAALDEAAAAAIAHLSTLFPALEGAEGIVARRHVRAALVRLLLGEGDAAHRLPLAHGEDAFGHPFALDSLPLPRAGRGYAVQMLGTDQLLDRQSKTFLPVRDPSLVALFESFAAARAAARQWVGDHAVSPEDQPLAIVPVGYDDTLRRHILIYGVLPKSP